MLCGPTVGRGIIAPVELLYYSVLHLAFSMAEAEFSNHRNFIFCGKLLIHYPAYSP
jgi:hypothetical protein